MTRSEAGKLGAVAAQTRHATKAAQFRETYAASPKTCGHCKLPLKYESRRSKFCSHSCSASVVNSVRHRRDAVVISPHPCEGCGEMITTRRARRFCSSSCFANRDSHAWIVRWLAGEETGVTSDGMGVSVYIHRWLREHRGEKCEECGWACVNPHTKRVPIQLHHVDGDALNNRPDNLKLLCPNCHSLTETFGGRNRGRGRKVRYAKKED